MRYILFFICSLFLMVAHAKKMHTNPKWSLVHAIPFNGNNDGHFQQIERLNDNEYLLFLGYPSIKTIERWSKSGLNWNKEILYTPDSNDPDNSHLDSYGVMNEDEFYTVDWPTGKLKIWKRKKGENFKSETITNNDGREVTCLENKKSSISSEKIDERTIFCYKNLMLRKPNGSDRYIITRLSDYDGDQLFENHGFTDKNTVVSFLPQTVYWDFNAYANHVRITKLDEKGAIILQTKKLTVPPYPGDENYPNATRYIEASEIRSGFIQQTDDTHFLIKSRLACNTKNCTYFEDPHGWPRAVTHLLRIENDELKIIRNFVHAGDEPNDRLLYLSYIDRKFGAYYTFARRGGDYDQNFHPLPELFSGLRRGLHRSSLFLPASGIFYYSSTEAKVFKLLPGNQIKYIGDAPQSCDFLDTFIVAAADYGIRHCNKKGLLVTQFTNDSQLLEQWLEFSEYYNYIRALSGNRFASFAREAKSINIWGQ